MNTVFEELEYWYDYKRWLESMCTTYLHGTVFLENDEFRFSEEKQLLLTMKTLL